MTGQWVLQITGLYLRILRLLVLLLTLVLPLLDGNDTSDHLLAMGYYKLDND